MEILSGKTREPFGGINLTNYTVVVSLTRAGLGPSGWGEALFTQSRGKVFSDVLAHAIL